MTRHPFQPDPVAGAASYWSDTENVMMKDTEGYVSCIQVCRTSEAACNAALRWQKKENAIVLREAKKLAR